MIAIDWSHVKELATYDGKKSRTESLATLLKRIVKDDKGDESIVSIQSPTTLTTTGEESSGVLQSNDDIHSPAIVLEQGCPLNLIYRLLLAGARVFTISNRATEDYRKAHNIAKKDEADAKIIYELANNGNNLRPVSLDNKLLQLHDAYHQYCRYQKARVALTLMKKAHERQYKGAESTIGIKSTLLLQAPDLSPYDIAISMLEGREKSLIKRCAEIAKGAPLFETLGGESITVIQSTPAIQPPNIKGLGDRLWLGIIITANPANFKCLSAYLRFCGLTGDVVESHKYNRHAKMLYHLLAEETMKHRDPKFRPLYDKCKTDITEKHSDYTKGHCHNGALNRVATFLAKEVYNMVKGVKIC